LLLLTLFFSDADNYLLRFTSVILRVLMLGLLASPVQFFSDSLSGPIVSSTTTLYRVLLLFNTFFIYLGVASVFQLIDRDIIGRKTKKK